MKPSRDRMLVTVASVADFYRLAVPAYAELLGTATTTTEGRPRLDVEFAPGVYSGSGLTLGQPSSHQAIDLDLHAADLHQPPSLVDMTIDLHARRIRLAGLLFENGSDDRPQLRLTLEHELEIERCAFIGNRTGTRAGDRLLEFVAAGVDSPVEVRIRASWFIRNYAPQASTLMAFDARAPHAFGRILLEDVAFLTNDAYCCVAPGGASAVDVERCVIREPSEASVGADRRFIAVTSPDTRIHVAESLIVRESLDGFVSRWSARHPSAAEYQPVTISDSRLVLHTPLAAAGPLADYELDDSPVETANRVFEDQLDVSQRVDMLSDQARRGSPPRLDALASQFAPAPHS